MQTIHRIDAKKTSAKTSSFAEPLEQRIAPAGVFRWNATGGGAWNSPANWVLVSGDLGQGFPDGTSDEAQLTNAITVSSVITIPDNVEITLGKLRFDDNNSYTIASVGSGHLTMFSSSGEATIISTNANGIASHFIQAPIKLASDTTFINSTNSPLVIQTSITELGQYRSVTKNGTGVVSFAGAGANSYTGETTVLDGILHLAKNEGINAIGGNELTIGKVDGVANPKVILDASEQIPTNTQVYVIDNATLDLANFTESFSNLTLVDEAAVTTGTGVLNVSGIVAGNYAPGTSTTISGNLNLTGPASILVINTTTESHLNISAVIKGSSGLTKLGTGVLELSSASAQQYTGQTTISQGTLLLKTNTSDAGISNEIRIEKDGLLRVANNFEIPDSATVTIAGGRMEVGLTEDFRNLTLDGGTVWIESGATFSIRKGGSVTVPGNFAAGGSSIEGAGTFRLMEEIVPFVIGDTADDVDLNITVPMVGLLSNAALLKSGGGKLALMGDGSYMGGNYVVAGTLTLGGEQSSRLTITGGNVGGAEYSEASFNGLVGSGGRIVPNYNFKSAGNVVMGAGTVFAPYYGSGTYDLEVTGTVDVSGAKLDFTALSLPGEGYLQEMVIIENDGADAVVGTFEGLAEGATLETPRGNFTISYVGGSGNDVTLTPVYVAPTILPGGKAATFIDVDGDRVTVRVSKGTLTADNFKLIASGAGAQLKQLTLDDAGFEGTSLKVTAVPKNGLGDRQVDLGHLKAAVDFTTISITGDLGYFEIGSEGTTTPAFKSMSVKSVGYSEPSSLPGSTYVSVIKGAFGALKVKGDVIGTNIVAGVAGATAGSIAVGGSLLPGTSNGSAGIYVKGNIGKLSIAGDIIGGSGYTTLRVTENAGKVFIGGSIVGGTGIESGLVELSGTVGSLNIGGDIIGGGAIGSGTFTLLKSVGSVKIGGSVIGGEHEGTGRVAISGDVKTLTLGQDLRGSAEVNAGAVFVQGAADTVKIGGSITGGASGSGLYALTFGSIAVGRDVTGTSEGRAVICAQGISNPVDAKSALAIASLTVGRDVNQADILAGYHQSSLSPSEADVQIGKIAVKGDWNASRALAGIRSMDGIFGNEDDQPYIDGSAEIASRIASIVIQGSVRGTIGLGDSYGFVAEEIGALSVAGKKIALDPATKDAVALGSFGDTTVREV